ncbi:MAG TPA: PAS domain S-box protein [Anaerolineales bacterium]|nr:PAS domain S-box protein [Anaerolineales bacterium]
MATINGILRGNGHKEAEEHGLASLHLLPLIMNNIPQAIFWKDKDLVYLGCNQAFAEDAGFSSPEEVVGKTDFDMPWKEQAELYRADDWLVMQSGNSKLNYEEPQTTPDGSILWLRTSKIAVQENGETVAVLGMYEDITAQKQAEKSLQQSEATLSSALRVAQMGHWEFDIAAQTFTFNDQYYALHGRTAAEVGSYRMSVQRFAQEFVYPEDGPIVGQATQQAIESTDPDFQVRTEARILHADGNPRWVSVWFRVVKDSQGRTIKLHGVNQDITERKRAQELLQQSEATLLSALRVAQMGHWEFDIASQMFILNDQYYSLHGTTAQEVGGYQLSVQRFAQEFVHPEDAAVVGQATQQAIEATDPNFHVQIEARILRADGKPRWVTVWFRIEKDAQGRTIKLHGVSQDITERKQLEAQVREAYERRGLQVQLSTQVSQSIAGAASLEELYERVVMQVKEQFGYYHTQLLRYDPAQEAVVLVTGYGDVGAKMLAAGHRLPMGEGLIGTAAATGETIVRSALRNDPDWQANPLLPETKGEIAIPIKLGGAILGVLDVQSSTAGALDADDQLLLEGLCGQIATAIESTRLRQEMSERLEEINRLYRAMSHEGWQNYRETADIPTSFMFDQGGLRPAQDTSLAEELFANIPLTVPGGEVIGLLAVADDPERPILPEDQAFLEQVAEQVALALESARLFEQTQLALAITQESETRLSEALDIAKLANWEYDLGRDRFIFNDHFYSIFRTTAEQVGGYELSSAEYSQLFVHPDDAPIVGLEIGKAVAATDRHSTTKVEHRCLFADGSVGYMSVAVNIERDENGKITRWYGANQDITERKRAEETIKAEQQRTKTILESVTVPMVITRLSDNHLTFVNGPALEATQFSYDQVINQPSPDFYANPEDRKKFITELRTSGTVSDMVVQLLRVNGEVFWALLSAQVFDYQGEASILTTFMDITDRIRAQEALAKRATELATVAQVGTATSTMLDPDKLLQAVVDLTKERFGLYHVHIYLADETWQTLLLAAGAGEVGQQMVSDGWNIPMGHESSIVAEATRTRQPVIANDVHRDKESSFLSNQLLPDTHSEMAVPIIVGEKLLGVFDVQSDVTGYFTEEDANIYITLASQVGVALQNARLYVEQAATLTQVRELDKLKSSFLANMSHELRTPLNSILGFTDVMLEGLDGDLTENMDNDLRLIQKNGQHLLHLINDVLDMAKIEAGRMNLNPESFKAYEVLEEVASITSTLASEKNLALFIEEDSDQDVKIYADRTRLRQVMINLVNNSIKFTETGKIAIKVAPMEDARVLITVKDTGIGIAPDKLDAIFQEFTQVDSSTTRKAGGTGLGLPISRRLVEMHGGRLWAESTGIPREGSVFFVELPLEARITEVVEKQEKAK